jgi:hypothetical protein
MIGPQLIELAQIAEQENMNRGLAHQAARRARTEAKAASNGRARSSRRFRWAGGRSQATPECSTG